MRLASLDTSGREWVSLEFRRRSVHAAQPHGTDIAIAGGHGKMVSAGSHQSRRAIWRRSVAAGVGTAVEYYDFQLFGILSVSLGRNFFPNTHAAASLLATLAVFGGAFLARPLGGFVFGLLGDTRGRTAPLVMTVLGMGIASAATGMLPTFPSAGLAAPGLLVLVRLAQGFFAGGEITGAATFIAENTPARDRGFFGAFNPAAAVFGLTLATGVVGLTEWMLGQHRLDQWGWRIPFLLSIPLTLVCFQARRLLHSGDHAQAASANAHRDHTPVVEVIVGHARPLAMLICLASVQNITAYTGLLFLTIQLARTFNYDPVSVSWLMSSATLAAGLAMPFAGKLSDRLGRKPVMGVGLLGYVVTAPIMFLIAASGHFEWTVAAVIAGVVPFVLVQASGYPLYVELFPKHVRYSGMSLGFNVATILGGGTAPYIAACLIERTGSTIAPGFLMSGAALVGFVLSLFLRETARVPLTSIDAAPDIPDGIPAAADQNHP